MHLLKNEGLMGTLTRERFEPEGKTSSFPLLALTT